MSMSVLALIQSYAREYGLPVPTAIQGGEAGALQLREVLTTCCEDSSRCPRVRRPTIGCFASQSSSRNCYELRPKWWSHEREGRTGGPQGREGRTGGINQSTWSGLG